MNKLTGNEPVYSRPYSHDERPSGRYEGDRVETYQAIDGLTIRQHFAGLAMQGMAASNYWAENFISKEASLKPMAEVAVMAADALIAELNKP